MKRQTFLAWINEPSGVWFLNAELVMNSLRKRIIGEFRQLINEPAAEANPLSPLVLGDLGSNTHRKALGMFMNWPSLNHSWPRSESF